MREYSFAPAVRLSLFYALAQNIRRFEQFSELRNHIEAAFWNEACAMLQTDDLDAMRTCIASARAKLTGNPIFIPNEEHRAFHLRVFKHLDNPFVTGVLEAYWDAYDAVELNRFADYAYLQQVWDYHEKILDAICAGDFDAGKQLFTEHTRLIRFRQPAAHTSNGTPHASP
jgi:DNA-binding FadR family transcriptional regulator